MLEWYSCTVIGGYVSMIARLGNLAEAFIDFVYPPVCSTCGRTLKRDEAYVCMNCWDSFERVPPTESVIQLIEGKFLADEAVDKIDSVFLFEQDPRVREAMHLLKYSGAEAIAAKFGLFIAKKIVNDAKLSMCDAIAPVPLHPARRRERGYNQSELIAESISGILQMQHSPGLLVRIRQTQTQTSFDAEGRKKNISGAFALGRHSDMEITGMKILLVDDVITTGATIKECARTLKSHGASEVYAASAAIAI